MPPEPLSDPPELKSAWRLDKWLPELLRHHQGRPGCLGELNLPLLQVAIRHRNVNWPRMISSYLQGKDVLDVGCGRSFFSVGFWFAGAGSYTGVDPSLNPNSNDFKDSSPLHGQFVKSQWTPALLESALPRTRLVAGLTSDLPAGSTFDVVAMHNVTEHLMQIEDAFAEFASLLRPGGRIIFRHPSYHAWSGHHMKPRSVAGIIPGDPEQAKYMDWAHLHPRADWPDKITKRQNRIRLHELRALTERFFEIERWEPRRSLPDEGGERLTEAILARSPGFDAEELLTASVLCVAVRK